MQGFSTGHNTPGAEMINHSEKKISIIMATYNRANYLPRAVNSVLNQSYPNIELIIIDDGSADNTEEVVKSFKDNRIRFIKNEHNQGMSVARNRGFDSAGGDYLALFDDDDELLPGALETVAAEFRSLTAKGIDARWIWFNGAEAETQKSSGRAIKEDSYVSYEDELCGKMNQDYFVVLERSLLSDQDRFDPLCWGYEHLLWLKLFRKSRAYYISKTLRRNYIEHPGRVSSFESRLKHLSGSVYAAKAFITDYGNDLKRLFPDYYAEGLRTLGSYQILAGEKGEGRRNLQQSFRYKFSPAFFLFFLTAFILSKDQIIFLAKKSSGLRYHA
jgi:glycosyltransferase involved in cell wall biosynthesis